MANPESLTLTGPEAASLANLSEKTLKRAADRGEPVGRFRAPGRGAGGAVRYHRATLAAWIESQIVPAAAPK